jgi:hypothetical protein
VVGLSEWAATVQKELFSGVSYAIGIVITPDLKAVWMPLRRCSAPFVGSSLRVATKCCVPGLCCARRRRSLNIDLEVGEVTGLDRVSWAYSIISFIFWASM